MARKGKENDKSSCIQNAIEEKRAELTAIAEELKAAEGDAVKIVAGQKKERRAKGELEALEMALKAASYMPPEPTDQQELLACLQKYQDEWDQRIQIIKKSIAEVCAEMEQIESDLQKATAEADTKRIVELSGRRDELKETNKHLTEILEKAEAIPVYPYGAISAEWDAICKKSLPEWNNRVMQVNMLAEAYKAAVDALLQMAGTLKAVRTDLERKSGEIFASLYTVGGDPESMVIDDRYKPLLHNLYAPITGKAL